MSKASSKTKNATPNTSHYFIDGWSSRTGLIGLVAYPNRLRGTDTEFTTFYTAVDGDWAHETFDFDGRSVVFQGEPATGDWWVLGKRGEVARLGDDTEFEQIPNAGTGPKNYGYLNRIACVEDQLYVCGFRRQVCVRRDGRWQRLDAGMLEPLSARGTSLEAIDGTASDCLYAVGSGGQIWHYDGKAWRQCASPTNVDLHEVRCVSRDRVLIVGQRGVVLIGALDAWTITADPDFDEDLWGVAEFEGEVYLAGYGGLGRLHATGVDVLDLGLRRTVLGYRLRTQGGLLWSVGNDDVVCFDGKRWVEVVCPDNVP